MSLLTVPQLLTFPAIKKEVGRHIDQIYKLPGFTSSCGNITSSSQAKMAVFTATKYFYQYKKIERQKNNFNIKM